MIYELNGVRIHPTQQFTHDDVQYPPGWLQLAGEDDLAALGIVALPDPERSNTEVILEQIILLESSITPRRIREAVLDIDNGWLKSINEQCALLRSKLQ